MRATRLVGRRHEGVHAEEAVRHALVAMQLDRHVETVQTARVRLAFVAQWVVLAGQHQRGRQAAEVGGVQRRGERVARVAVGPEVALPEERHVLGGEQVPGREVAVGLRILPGVGDGVHEHLRREGRPRGAGSQRDGGREVPAGRVAGDGEAARFPAERTGVLGEPGDRRLAVIERGREGVLRREAVVEADDERAGRVRESSADPVVGVDPHEHPAAAVEVRDHRQRVGVGARRVAASPQGSGVGVELAVLDARHGLGRAGAGFGEDDHVLAQLVQRLVAERRQVEARGRVEVGLQRGVERHQPSAQSCSSARDGLVGALEDAPVPGVQLEVGRAGELGGRPPEGGRPVLVVRAPEEPRRWCGRSGGGDHSGSDVDGRAVEGEHGALHPVVGPDAAPSGSGCRASRRAGTMVSGVMRSMICSPTSGVCHCVASSCHWNRGGSPRRRRRPRCARAPDGSSRRAGSGVRPSRARRGRRARRSPRARRRASRRTPPSCTRSRPAAATRTQGDLD